MPSRRPTIALIVEPRAHFKPQNHSDDPLTLWQSEEDWRRFYLDMIAEAEAADINVVFTFATRYKVKISHLFPFRSLLARQNSGQTIKQRIPYAGNKYDATYCLVQELRLSADGRRSLLSMEYRLLGYAPQLSPIKDTIPKTKPLDLRHLLADSRLMPCVTMCSNGRIEKSIVATQLSERYRVSLKDIIYYGKDSYDIGTMQRKGCQIVSAEALYPDPADIDDELAMPVSSAMAVLDSESLEREFEETKLRFIKTMRARIIDILWRNLPKERLRKIDTALQSLKDEELLMQFSVSNQERIKGEITKINIRINIVAAKVASLKSYYFQKRISTPNELLLLDGEIFQMRAELRSLTRLFQVTVGRFYLQKQLVKEQLVERAYQAIRTALNNPLWSECVSWGGGVRLENGRIVPAGIATMLDLLITDGRVTDGKLNELVLSAASSLNRGASFFSFITRDERTAEFYRLVTLLGDTNNLNTADIKLLEAFSLNGDVAVLRPSEPRYG